MKMKLLTKAKSNLQALANVRKLKLYVPTGCILTDKNKGIWQVTCRKRRRI
jgi:hypothetical protein